MTDEKCREVLALYEQVLQRDLFGTDIEHLRTMIPQMRTMLDEIAGIEWHEGYLAGKSASFAEMLKATAMREKFMRWLGFIQGAFWSMEVFTIEQMKEHNRP